MRLQHHISQNAIGVLDTVYDSVFVGCLKYSTLFMALSLPFHHWLGMCIRAWLDYICTSLIIGKLAYHIKEQQKNRHAVRAWHCEVTCDYDIAQICVISVRSSKKKRKRQWCRCFLLEDIISSSNMMNGARLTSKVYDFCVLLASCQSAVTWSDRCWIVPHWMVYYVDCHPLSRDTI